MRDYLSELLIGMIVFLMLSGCGPGVDPTGPSGMEQVSIRPSGWSGGGNFGSSAGKHMENGMQGHYSSALITRELGGTLNFRNGALIIPPMSIDETKVIGARTYSLEHGDFFKKIYEFDPSGTTFDPPATLILNYCDLGPIVPESIILRVFNDHTGQWEIASMMVNDPVNRTFTGYIEHFSRYSLSGNGQVLQPKTL